MAAFASFLLDYLHNFLKGSYRVIFRNPEQQQQSAAIFDYCSHATELYNNPWGLAVICRWCHPIDKYR